MGANGAADTDERIDAALHAVTRGEPDPGSAIHKQLRVLARQPGWREVSLWLADEAEGLRCECHVGERPSRGLVAVVRQVHAEGRATPASPRRTLVAAPVPGADAPAAALAARIPAGGCDEALRVMGIASPHVALMVQRRQAGALAARIAEVVAVTDRRLARFGLDLHDGPTQSACALLTDIRLFASQLGRELGGQPHAAILRGRVGDLEARAEALETEIRELARAAGAPAVLDVALADALQNECDAFAESTRVTPGLKLAGPLDEATASQRITLLRAVQEALRNIRQHGGAGKVLIRAEAKSDRIDAEIWDDGRGFDAPRTLARAERHGRLGLSGIAARVRLLGGRCVIRSRPGGPTSVAISLPRWPEGREPKAER